MNVIWNDAKKKCNVSDNSFENIIDDSQSPLLQDDKDFILTSYNAGMYNYVVEYVYNKSVKMLQDAVFSIGEDIVVNITHWIDRSYISNFFDVFILRLACDFDLITKEEKLKIMQIIEFLQKRNDAGQVNVEIDKEMAKYYIVTLFDAILYKDFTPFTESVVGTLNCLYKVNILPYSEIYNEIIESTNKRKNLFTRIMFAMLKTAENNKDEESYKILFQNAKNLFPFLWDTANLNDKKFIAYYLKCSNDSSPVKKVFEEISTQIKLQDFNTDVNVVTKILKSCQEVLYCHYGVNNHKDEVAALINLSEVNFFPNYFLRSVITPCLVTYLGNNNGYIHESREISEKILSNITPEKWTFYFKNFFSNDDFVLMNLIMCDGCLKDWSSIVKKSGVDLEDLNNEDVKSLLEASKSSNFENIKKFANKLYNS